ncbi:MAG TPA: AAA family ATPase [Conexibacter sp.]|jgi:DNA-binding CsgD family transcriptional regulator
MRILERERDLAALQRMWADASAGDGACAVVAGTAGIGKTTLLHALTATSKGSRALAATIEGSRAVTATIKGSRALAATIEGSRALAPDGDGAAARSLGGVATGSHPLALHAAAGELEADVPFGVVRDLLSPLLEGERALSDAAALCAPVFGAGAQASGEPVNAGSILHGLYWLVADAAEREPIMLVVDDVQWADPASVRFLVYLARRLSDLRCLLALGLRVGPNARPRADVQALVELPSVRRLDLSALSPEGVSTLVGATLGRDVEPPFADACVTATGGNPLLCVALATELAHERVSGAAEELESVERAGAGRVATSVRRRIGRCGAAAPQVALAAAILGPSATYRRVRALAEVEEPDAAAAVDALISEDVLDGASPLGFAHPIVRAAVLDDVTETARARCHARAARLLADESLDEQAAHHLRNAEPLGDPAAVAVLRAAATRALGRGASEVAVTYLSRALQEPPPADQRAQLLLELGTAESFAGLPEAVDHFIEARDWAGPGSPMVQQIALPLGDAQMWRGRWLESIRTLERGIAAAPGTPTADLLQVQLLRAATGSVAVRKVSGGRLAQLRAMDAELRGDGNQLRTGLLALELAMTNGPAKRIIELGTEALLDGALLASGQSDGVHELTATALALADAAVPALREYDKAVVQASERGDALLAARSSVLRGWALQRFGRPADAEAEARSALELADGDTVNALLQPAAVGTLIAAVLDCRGPLAAREVADEFANIDGDEDGAGAQPLPLARGLLALAERRLDTAFAELDRCRMWEEGFSGGRSVAFMPWRAPMIAVLLLRGEEAEARALAAEQLAIAEEFGSAFVIGQAQHSCALVDRDISQMEQAVATLAQSPARMMHARALADLGSLLRARRQLVDARVPLRTALDIAVAGGATSFAGEVRDELRAAGGRPRRPRESGIEALTPAERRAALLAIEGLTNRQIAQASFVSPRTIEMHLSHAYRKLDVTGREGLRMALADEVGEAASA